MAITIVGLRRSIATALGAGLVGLSGWFSYHHTGDLAAPIAAIVGAAMLHFCEAAWSEGQRMRAVAFAALAALASFICLLAVLDRTATAYDRSVQGRQSENLPRDEARKAVARVEAEATAAEAAASAECTSGRGRRCATLEERAGAARQRVKEARAELVQLGSAIAVDPMARRLAALLPVSEATIGLVQPLMLPVWLELSGLVLLTYGLSPGHAGRRQAAAQRRRRKSRKTAARHRFRPSVGRPELKVVQTP
jgi:hypothetical protein